MEPIRPDEDELRNRGDVKATAKQAKSQPDTRRHNAEGQKNAKPAKPAKPARPAAERRPGGNRGVGLLSLVLIGLMVLGGYLWFEQEQRIKTLEGQLEEADYWARQSKLALARFEGALSETGENLEEAGASMEERLDAVDGEIRKLWALANERNRQQLQQHQSAIENLQAGLSAQGELMTAAKADNEALGNRVTEEVAKLDQRIVGQGEQLSGQVEQVSEQLAAVDAQVESRLQRFLQERRLADEEVTSRLTSLERQASQQAGASDLDRAMARVTELEQAVKAIDASRAQLTSRLVGLSEEVARLRQQQNGVQ